VIESFGENTAEAMTDMFIATAHAVESLGETATIATVDTIISTAQAVESLGKPVGDPSYATGYAAGKEIHKAGDLAEDIGYKAGKILKETAADLQDFVIGTKPEVYGINQGRKNLVLGGIQQDDPDVKNGNAKLKEIADANNAIYVPAYFDTPKDIRGEILDGIYVNNAAIGFADYKNGLKNEELQDKTYDTIISYSGGTATAVTAILDQGVRCDNLILVSPMDAAVNSAWYKVIIDAILDRGLVKHIQVIYSPQDRPTDDIYIPPFYEASSFKESDKISVKKVDFTKEIEEKGLSGRDIHIRMLYYVSENIHDGVLVDPDVSKSNVVQLSGSELLEESNTGNVQETAKQAKQSETQETSQKSQQNVKDSVQYSESSAVQGSSSADSFDAYSEGKRLAAEAFAAKYQSTQPSSEIAQGLEPITQTIAASSSESTAKNFKKGDRIETTDLLNVRSEPGLPEDGSQDTRISAPKSKGNTGTILNDQPVYADGFAWWKIQYDDGTIGWSQDKRLESQSAQEAPQKTDQVEAQEAPKVESTQDNDISFGSVHQAAQQAENNGASFGSEDTSFGASSFSSDDQSQKFGSSSDERSLAGINFTSIKLNSISVTTDSSGGINFDFILKAEKAEGSRPGINIQNASRIGAAAFMTGLAVNDNKFWVNLNPWEVDRIIDEELEQSEVGRIMLEADLQMKRDFSNYGNPCANETGKALWNLLDKKREDLVQRCMNKFPGEIKETSNIIFKPVQRHWIVPDKAFAYSNGSSIYIINASLAINSEPVTDHSSFHVKNQDINSLSRGCIKELNRSAQEYVEYCRNLEERMIQPHVVADINTDEKYEDLREVYAALALAQWYKSKVTIHTDIFRDSLDSSSSAILKTQIQWQPKDIWDEYVYSFKNGEYKCWENTTTKTAKGTRTKISLYSAGGVEFKDIRDHLVKIEAMPPEVQEQANRAITNGIVDSQNEVLFGYRLHVDQKKETQITRASSGSSIGSRDSSQGINDPLKENRTVNEASLTSKKAQIHSSEMPSVGKAGSNTSHVTCPDGWMGPDENGECWQMQITG